MKYNGLGICHYLGNSYFLKRSIRVTEGLSNIVLGEVKPLMVMSKFGLED